MKNLKSSFNKIIQIVRKYDSITKDKEEIKNEAVQFYQDLLSLDQRRNNITMEKVLENIPQTLGNKESEYLERFLDEK